MKKLLIIGLGILLGFFSMNSSVNALSLDYSNVVGAKVEFTGTGDTFSFNDSSIGSYSGYDFMITGASGSTDSDTLGLMGNISGTFTIGTITTPYAGKEEAAVTGTGTLTIKDEAAVTFTGTLDWIQIYTEGTGGNINAGGVVNLTGITYAGLNTDLLAFLSPNQGIVTSTFQFVPAKTLSNLTADGTTISTSYSGTIATPEPATLLLMGAGLLGLGIFGRKKIKG